MARMFDTIPASIEFIRAGKLHPLAVTSARRLDLLPDLPTVGDFLPGYEATSWSGIEIDLLIGISSCPQERNPCNGWNPTLMGVLIYK